MTCAERREWRLGAIQRQFRLIAGLTAATVPPQPPLGESEVTALPPTPEADGLVAGAVEGEAGLRLLTAVRKLNVDAKSSRCAREQQEGQPHDSAKDEMAAEAAQRREGDQTAAARRRSSASANSTLKARLADARDRDGRINSAAWSSISARAGIDD